MKHAQLLAWRKANRLTQQGAADRIGKSLETYSRYERGKSPIPETVAARVMTMTSVDAPDEAVAPPIAKGETPWTHPHLYKRVGKKHHWERIDPGDPLADPEVYMESVRAVQREEEIKALEPLPDTIDWDDDVDGEHDPED